MNVSKTRLVCLLLRCNWCFLSCLKRGLRSLKLLSEEQITLWTLESAGQDTPHQNRKAAESIGFRGIIGLFCQGDCRQWANEHTLLPNYTVPLPLALALTSDASDVKTERSARLSASNVACPGCFGAPPDEHRCEDHVEESLAQPECLLVQAAPWC